MALDDQLTTSFYQTLPDKAARVRAFLKRPLTLTEKILYTHLSSEQPLREFKRGQDYVAFAPDRVAMQDATAQMALLQLMNAGRRQVAVPSSVHCDHLIQAYKTADADLSEALISNREVYNFLRSVSKKYGIGFWEPGSGIIHQVVLENYAFPGGLMIGTDSHTPNAGGLGVAAIGVGGADAVDVMAGMPWELKMPTLIGVRLTGSLNGWSSPKDVILKLAGILTVKGGTNAVIEYFGPGVAGLSATGRATICNMGAEVGATTSLFPFDQRAADYLKATGRATTAEQALAQQEHLTADPEVLANPEAYYDRLIDIDLNTLEPHVNGPYTPDAATPLSSLSGYVDRNNYPHVLEAGLIGSCTNSSYEDMTRAASVLKQALEQGLTIKTPLLINPGSEQIRRTAERDGLLAIFEQAGATLIANACGPCIGQWKRVTEHPDKPNAILTSFNRNFAKRNDGNPNTHAFVSSPEIVAALSIAGSLLFNPLTDTLVNAKGDTVKLNPPSGLEFPPKGYLKPEDGFLPPNPQPELEVKVAPDSQRLQVLSPFKPWEGTDLTDLALLIKASGKCTTDHISMAGPWLRFRGHLDNISDNLLMGAVNAFNGRTNEVLNPVSRTYEAVSTYARALKATGRGSIVVAEENYGEGSSREHAAMEPRHLNVRAIVVKSFARIHETNLKKQGMLALTFANKADYDLIREDDRFSILGLTTFRPGIPLTLVIHHADGSEDRCLLNHTYNQAQIEWFKAGSALNAMKPV